MSRLLLHDILVELLGTRYVYFQPPSTVRMQYPCIVYSIGEVNFSTRFANGLLYGLRKSYKVTLIDPNPDTVISDHLLRLPYCRFERYFAADNLNHYVYTLYF